MNKNSLPDERPAIVRRFELGGLKAFVIVDMYKDGSPGNILIRISKEGSTLSGFSNALVGSVSTSLQSGVPLEDIVVQFMGQNFEPNGRTNTPCVPQASSITDLLGRWLAIRFLSTEKLKELGIVYPCENCEQIGLCKKSPIKLTK